MKRIYSFTLLLFSFISTLLAEDITVYFVNTEGWSSVKAYVWPTGGNGLVVWPGEDMKLEDFDIYGIKVYSYTFDYSKATNIIFNNGSSGDKNQTEDLIVDKDNVYYCSDYWYSDKESVPILLNGIFYNLNTGNKTAEVTYRGDAPYSHNEYSGSVTIPETITYNSQTYSVTSIGYGAFSGCSELTSVTIPNSVTSIGNSAFEDCSGLTSVTIPNSVTSIGYGAFSNTGIYEDESNWDNGVLYIDNCLIKAKYDVVKGSYTIKKGTRIIGEDAFSYCSELTSVTIPNSVTSIGKYAFSGCSGLTSVTIPNSVTSIDGGAFEDCSRLTSVTIGESVTSIGDYAFDGCSELTSVTIPNSVTSIGQDAFNNCSGLTSITIGESVTSIGYYAFYGCSGLTSVIWNAKNCENFSSYSSSPFYECSNITSFTFGNGVEHIPARLCYGMSKLTEITIPNSVTSIGYSAFYKCSGLTSVTIPNSVTSIGEDAFYKCSGLTKVNYLGNVDKWVEIDFNDYDSNPTYYAKDLYLNNELLTDIKITTADSIKFDAFYNCKSIKSVEIGESVTSIGNSAFEDCSGLTSVTIPNSVTSIGDWTFSYCSGLTSVTIPNSVTSIGKYAFSDCSGLTSITIPNSVTSIGEDAFYGCSGLTEVTIGESVTSIGDYAFHGCDKLKKVTAYPTTVPNVYENSFAHYNAYLYVPCDVYEDYDLDDVFGNFKYVKCIAADEVDAPDKVEIDVDNDNNATITWPSTEGAKSYELEITKNGNVFCTLLFNEDGQLTSIDFGNRSASVGFQFTVTGLDSASKYAYSMVAMDKKGNELQSYKGTFTTNGYVPGPGEEDDHVSITETLADANITVSGGSISADAGFSIYNTIGQDVTSFNGSLQPGVYLVSIENNIVKVMVK